MADYSNARALAARLLAKKGFVANLEPQGVASDPITGEPMPQVASRALRAVFTQINADLFEGTTIQAADKMLLLEGSAEVGERFLGQSIVAVQSIDPDMSGPIISKALLR